MNAKFKPLLAKQPISGKAPTTLLNHALAVEKAASCLFRSDSRWASSYFRFFRLTDLQVDVFLTHLRVASLLHDLGKANEDFQAAVIHSLQTAQALRHEHLSALILHLDPVRRWLIDSQKVDVDLITAAILSHHYKASADGQWRWGQPSRLCSSLALHLDHPDIAAMFDGVAEQLGIGPCPALSVSCWTEQEPWQTARKNGVIAGRELKRSVRKQPERQSLLLALKLGLILADSTGSGLVRQDHSIQEWIEEVVHQEPIPSSELTDGILARRIEQVARRTGKVFEYQKFQLRAAEQGPRALLLAACGAGKTLAAWKWAEAQAKTSNIGKVVFLYPTRATATEGFRDYVAWADQDQGTLVHGTAKYELAAMMSNPAESMVGKSFESTEDRDRLFGLGLWSFRYFSATVDQFLAFLEHGYGSSCLLPILTDAAVVVDEVHSFDKRMFGDLIAFLKAFDVPVLCMTASLPPSRRQQLVEMGLKVYPAESDREELADLEAKETHPRYQLSHCDDTELAFSRAVQSFNEGKRVLWVVNQVKRAQRWAKRLAEATASNVLCYHSAFRLMDRQQVHSNVVQSFGRKGEPAIAVTTQVCEMSLDLDADLLISELAPVTALVQRFGRANRHEHEKPGGFCAELLVTIPDNALPYRKEELEASRSFLRELEEKDRFSQRDLAEGLERHASAEAKNDESAYLFEGGYFATAGSLRDSDGHTVPCILEGDLDAVRQLLNARRPIDAYVVPAPRKLADSAVDKPTWLPRYLGVAPSQNYSVGWGLVAKEENA